MFPLGRVLDRIKVSSLCRVYECVVYGGICRVKFSPKERPIMYIM